MDTEHPIVSQLQAVVGADGVLCQHDQLVVYECDGFPIAKGLPTAVVFPRTTEHVAACMKIAGEHQLQIVPRGSGTGLAGGAVAYGSGLIVCTTRMTQIEAVDLENRFAVVQPGVRNSALTDTIAGTGLRFSPDPSSQRAATIGGNVCSNAGGITTLKHGVTTNHILGLEFVTPDGQVHVIRSGGLCDGPGADLPGLICGSEGTLAFVTKIWCRLTPAPTNFRTVYAVFDSVTDACRTVSDVIASGIVPTSMEIIDGGMIRVVEDAFQYGFPTTAQALLLMEVDGIEAVLDDQMQHIAEIAGRNHSRDVRPCSDPVQRAELWSARKRAFGAIGRISRSYCTQDACVPRSKLPEIVEGIVRIGKSFGLQINNVFHAGDGNVHPVLLFDEDDPQQVQNTLACSEAILEYCIEQEGTITGEHGVGVEKLHLMHKMFNPQTLDTFNRIKETFDPHRQINDAKLIPSPGLDIQLHMPVALNVAGGAL